ncbi:MAG: hypothetical protein K9M84_01080 [Spirochaetia bacterium]|nr:hypothetical protein [Spirochaetia bacterium]MCF7940182.1 hypothetical protein [Spirochaetia bacterium]
MRIRELVIICAGALVLLSGCTHTTPFTDDHYFRALGRKNEMVVTVNMDQSAELLEGLSSEQQKLSAIDGILDRTDRISLSIDNSSGTAAAPAFYGGLEGNFGYFTANTALKFSREWKRETDSSVVYFHSDQNALDVMIPRSGIVLFSQGDMAEVYRRTYAERELFIPYEVSRKMGDGIAAMYMESPDDIMYLTDQIPRTMLLSIDSVWLVLTGTRDDYRLTGLISANNDKASRVLGTLLRMNYLVRVRALDVPLKDWQDDITIDGNLIMLEEMYMENKTVQDTFAKMLEQL